MAGAGLNPRHHGTRRIMAEARELSAYCADADAEFHAAPLEEDLFTWHFTLKGPPSSPYAGGLYHGIVLLPNNYPMAPPDIMLSTPSGRFETGKRVCVSVTSYHPESWEPTWGIRLVLTALRVFMVTPAKGAIGGIDDCPEATRVAFARRSVTWKCPVCDKANNELIEPDDPNQDETAGAAAPPAAEPGTETAPAEAQAEMAEPAAAAAAAAAAAVDGRAPVAVAQEGAAAVPAAAPAAPQVDPAAGVRGADEPPVVVPELRARAAPAAAQEPPVAAAAPLPRVAPAVLPVAAPPQQPAALTTLDRMVSGLFVTIVLLLMRKLLSPDDL